MTDDQLHAPDTRLTMRPGDRVHDLHGWPAGRVVEPRAVATRDEFFDGVLIDFRGKLLLVDAPDIRSVQPDAVVLRLTLTDLERAVSDRNASVLWPGGPLKAQARRPSEAPVPDDTVGLMAAVSRLHVAGRMSVASLERNLERVLRARTRADLDAIAAELLAAQAS
jgi:hypothetical protein